MRVVIKKEEEKETSQAQVVSKDENNESSNDISDYNTDKFENDDKLDNLMAPSLPEAVKICFKKYFDFKGRASRSEYWWFQLIVSPSYFISTFLENEISYFFLGITLFTLIPAISAGVRRLHDTNRSGFFLLLSFIPFIGGLILLFFFIAEGTKGKNKFGTMFSELIKRANPTFRVKVIKPNIWSVRLNIGATKLPSKPLNKPRNKQTSKLTN